MYSILHSLRSRLTPITSGRACALVCLLLASTLFTPTASGQVSTETTARRLLQEGRIDEALSAVEGELRQRPRDGQLLLLKGAALSSGNRQNEAIKVFRRMIEEKIEEASAFNNLAVIYAGRGEFESARTALEWAVRSKPDYGTAHHNLGNVYANLASMSYKRALQLDRSDHSLPAKLAQLGEVLGQPAAPGRDNGQPDTATSGAEKKEILATVTPPSISTANNKRSPVAEANFWQPSGN
jgi:Flp pilus assembly protein TadD